MNVVGLIGLAGTRAAGSCGFREAAFLPLFVFLDRYIAAEGKLFIRPVAPMVGSVGFAHLAVAEHDAVGAAVGLEDACAEVNV